MPACIPTSIKAGTTTITATEPTTGFSDTTTVTHPSCDQSTSSASSSPIGNVSTTLTTDCLARRAFEARASS